MICPMYGDELVPAVGERLTDAEPVAADTVGGDATATAATARSLFRRVPLAVGGLPPARAL